MVSRVSWVSCCLYSTSPTAVRISKVYRRARTTRCSLVCSNPVSFRVRKVGHLKRMEETKETILIIYRYIYMEHHGSPIFYIFCCFLGGTSFLIRLDVLHQNWAWNLTRWRDGSPLDSWTPGPGHERCENVWFLDSRRYTSNTKKTVSVFAIVLYYNWYICNSIQFILYNSINRLYQGVLRPFSLEILQ